ncbi:MAG: RtcB family protein [Saprospirales bacterium]|nr:RtcB family protein [Saprospirales bacterium]
MHYKFFNKLYKINLSLPKANYCLKLETYGLDEALQAYKDIREVMKEQTDLVDIVCTFYPKIVKMDQ